MHLTKIFILTKVNGFCIFWLMCHSNRKQNRSKKAQDDINNRLSFQFIWKF